MIKAIKRSAYEYGVFASGRSRLYKDNAEIMDNIADTKQASNRPNWCIIVDGVVIQYGHFNPYEIDSLIEWLQPLLTEAPYKSIEID